MYGFLFWSQVLPPETAANFLSLSDEQSVFKSIFISVHDF